MCVIHGVRCVCICVRGCVVCVCRGAVGGSRQLPGEGPSLWKDTVLMVWPWSWVSVDAPINASSAVLSTTSQPSEAYGCLITSGYLKGEPSFHTLIP